MGKSSRKGANLKADVIILGCSLPGIVTANKLKRKFGNTMDIIVLDLAGVSKVVSKCNVAFQDTKPGSPSASNSEDDSDIDTDLESWQMDDKLEVDTIARHYLIKYAKEFRVPVPSAIINPMKRGSPLNKLFQHRNGSSVPCTNHFNDFDYLNYAERFELNQYQNYLDESMKRLFKTNTFSDPTERKILLSYDQTTMEKSICETLIFHTSREIMRTNVELMCGAPANTVSLLFFLHQCYRTNGMRHHIDGQNTRLREKLLGYCRKRLASQLQKDIADITLPAKAIKKIRTYSEADAEQVVLETKMGDTIICNSLAVALKPDQLQTIDVDDQLLPEQKSALTKGFTPGKAKKFVIQYEERFWAEKGYSGDILSLRGPIIWAIERPNLSLTGSVEKYAALIGYLMVRDDENAADSKEAVLEQLTNLFGPEAAEPVTYRETAIADIFVPQCGDYVGLRVLTNEVCPRGLEWGAFDIFAEGDVAAALEAGHTAYLHLLSCLRPQAQTFEDISANYWPVCLDNTALNWWLAHVNILSTMKVTACTAAVGLGIQLIRMYFRR